MGAKPDEFAAAAALMAESGYDVIDINFGCPVRKVLGRCRGGYLLSDPPTGIEIIRRVRDAVPAGIPVTLKMRRGMDDTDESTRNFFEIFDAAVDAGLAAITVHGRTVAQKYVGPSDWSFLTRLKQYAPNVTILGSGDLYTADDCLRMLAETGIDGVSVARGCIGNPWIFRELQAAFERHANVASHLNAGGEHADADTHLGQASTGPTVAEQGQVIRQHYELIKEIHGEQVAHRHILRFGVRYSDVHPNHKRVRLAWASAKTPEQVERVLTEWYDPHVEWAPARRKRGEDALVAAGACM